MADDGKGTVDQSLFTDAALGSLDAQRTIRDRALALVAAGVQPVGESALLAEAFARLAAGHGQVEDSAKLAGTLMLRSHVSDMTAEVRDMTFAEGLGRVALAADEGHEPSATMMALTPQAGISPKVFAMARSWIAHVTGR